MPSFCASFYQYSLFWLSMSHFGNGSWCVITLYPLALSPSPTHTHTHLCPVWLAYFFFPSFIIFFIKLSVYPAGEFISQIFVSVFGVQHQQQQHQPPRFVLIPSLLEAPAVAVAVLGDDDIHRHTHTSHIQREIQLVTVCLWAATEAEAVKAAAAN